MITKTIGELPARSPLNNALAPILFSRILYICFILLWTLSHTYSDTKDGKIAKPYDERVDFWSLGVTAYAFLYGMCPFYQVSDKSEINEATRSMELEYDGG
jgi:serine/threonine protein kinase